MTNIKTKQHDWKQKLEPSFSTCLPRKQIGGNFRSFRMFQDQSQAFECIRCDGQGLGQKYQKG